MCTQNKNINVDLCLCTCYLLISHRICTNEPACITDMDTLSLIMSERKGNEQHMAALIICARTMLMITNSQFNHYSFLA